MYVCMYIYIYIYTYICTGIAGWMRKVQAAWFQRPQAGLRGSEDGRDWGSAEKL